MPTFEYRARDPQGKIKIGAVEASTRQSATEILQANRFLIISLVQKEIGISERFNDLINPIRTKDKVVMTRQLSTMFEAGLPAVEAMKVLAKQTANPTLKKLITEIAANVEGGAKLSDAFAQYPKVFSRFYVNLLRAGETTGNLDKNLKTLADQMERNYQFITNIRSALMYPAFILFGIVVVMIIMMTFVLPQLSTVLGESGQELPFLTRVLIGVSDFFTNYWWAVIIALIGLGIFFYYYRKSPSGRRTLDLLKIKVPILGPVFQRLYIARFTSNLSSLLEGDIPIVKALEIVSRVVNNEIYREYLQETAEKVKGGASITSVIEEKKEIPPTVSYMMNVGEKTGRLSEILQKVARFYTNEVDASIKGIISLIEPALMVVSAVAVGFVVAAVILPIYNLTGAL